jgi:NADPH:quinone reductase-like Zn-dependent oxidoreductase
MSTQKVYRIQKHEGIDNLVLSTAEIPKPKRKQVLVRIRATSLNFRDLMVITGKYPPPYPENLIPLSDGAGEVAEVGEDVSSVKVGDRVAANFFPNWISGEMTDENFQEALGGTIHGMLCQYRVFEEESLVKIPSHLSYEEAATLPCAALTAWNALQFNGLKPIGPGQTVLIQGTGGVSMFGLQFAAAAGARVIVTSSSDAKLQKAKQFGAAELINYKTHPDWHVKVRELTGGKGVDHVIEVGGSGTLKRSLGAVKRGGQVHMIGVLSQPELFDVGLAVLFGVVNLKGVFVGSKSMFENMNQVMEYHKIHPVVDRVFEFSEAKEAYKYFSTQQHVGKVVIRVE